MPPHTMKGARLIILGIGLGTAIHFTVRRASRERPWAAEINTELNSELMPDICRRDEQYLPKLMG